MRSSFCAVLLSIFLVVFAGRGVAAAPDNSAALIELRTEVIRVIRETHPEMQPVADADPAMITVATKTGSGTLSVLNLARMVKSSTGINRRAEILRFVERAVPKETPENQTKFDAAKSHLRIQIAPAEYASISTKEGVINRAFTNDLIIAYVIDYDDHIEYVQKKHLQEWRVGRETVEKIAIENLDAALASEPDPGRTRPIGQRTIHGVRRLRRLRRRSYSVSSVHGSAHRRDGTDGVHRHSRPRCLGHVDTGPTVSSAAGPGRGRALSVHLPPSDTEHTGRRRQESETRDGSGTGEVDAVAANSGGDRTLWLGDSPHPPLYSPHEVPAAPPRRDPCSAPGFGSRGGGVCV